MTKKQVVRLTRELEEKLYDEVYQVAYSDGYADGRQSVGVTPIFNPRIEGVTQ